MKAVIQRVTKASVTVGYEVIGSIGRGLCVLIGIASDDNDDDMEFISRKILNLRLFDAENKRWDKSVKDLDLQVLSISQFTLHGILKGNKLDFHRAMEPTGAQQFYNRFLDKLKKDHKPDRIEDGRFGALMNVNICNDGPVTVTIDSRDRDSNAFKNGIVKQ